MSEAFKSMSEESKQEIRELYPTVGSEFTVRAALTGMLLGGMLSLCNIYSGLKIGWGFNVSIVAVLLSYGFWNGLHAAGKCKKWGILENNLNHTAASSAAAVSSAGLVAPIPALAILTGFVLPWHWLAIWVFSVCMVGIAAAIALRRQMLIEDKLPFAAGMATGETLKEIYAHGAEALARVKVLLTAAGTSIVVKAAQVWMHLETWAPGITVPLKKAVTVGVAAAPAAGSGSAAAVAVGSGAAAAGTGTSLSAATLKNLTFGVDPSLMMLGIGSMNGWRTCWSVMFGAVIAWGVIGPIAIDAEWVAAADMAKMKAAGSWYNPMLKWLLWPGVAMMVAASLASFAFSWRSILNTFLGHKSADPATPAAGAAGTAGGTPETTASAATTTDPAAMRATDVIGSGGFGTFLVIALVISVALQIYLFKIAWWAASLGVLLSLVLAIVAGRVSGEAGVTPVGAMGKVTQLFFGVVTPGDAAANLMAANVTGGASSQCADLLHDMKTGMIVGASPRLLSYVQICGALAGSLIGSAAYLVLVPDPAKMLMTDEWPAPAVAAWLAVAKIFQQGIQAMPPMSGWGLAVGALVGVILTLVEKYAPKTWRPYIPSPASVGLAFVIPASNSVMIFLGGIIAKIMEKLAPEWSEKYLTVTAAGLVAGESLAGVTIAIKKMVLP